MEFAVIKFYYQKFAIDKIYGPKYLVIQFHVLQELFVKAVTCMRLHGESEFNLYFFRYCQEKGKKF